MENPKEYLVKVPVTGFVEVLVENHNGLLTPKEASDKAIKAIKSGDDIEGPTYTVNIQYEVNETQSLEVRECPGNFDDENSPRFKEILYSG
jgi:hypothetical protein